MDKDTTAGLECCYLTRVCTVPNDDDYDDDEPELIYETLSLLSLVKSPLSASVEMPCEEEDNHQHPLFVGSWTSVSSAESFLSATSSFSSDYASADEDF